MPTRQRSLAAATVTLALAGSIALSLVGCNDSDVLAPSNGQIIVEANPANVLIDVVSGQSSGQSLIRAQVFDEGGFPLSGIDMTFSTTGGLLASASNICGTAGTCSLSGGACSSNGDCPAVAPRKVKTDRDGVAADTLTLRLADPSSVDVSVRSATLAESVSVAKTVSQGNVQPEAVIVATPALAQRKGRFVSFNGQDSDDPDGTITCYQWQIQSTVVADEIVQGQSTTLISRRYDTEQDLTVRLRVSDDPDAADFCGPGAPAADPSLFSPLVDQLDYEIVCDLTNPVVDGGPNRILVLPQASVTLTGNASDPDAAINLVRWSCANSQADVEASNTTTLQVTCTYTTPGTFNAQFFASNSCGLTSTDTVTITVNAASP